MKTTALLLSFILVISLSCLGQKTSNNLSSKEIAEINQAMENDTLLSNFVNYFGGPQKVYSGFKLRMEKAKNNWEKEQKTTGLLKNIGYTTKFELLPLEEHYANNDTLIGHGGVSYLIKTDDATILFDLGVNLHNEHPSPLLKNMKELGVELDDIDIIVISHNHGDHVGGGKWSKLNTFSLTEKQIELGKKDVYTPEEMSYPGLNPYYSKEPKIIAKGVATIGVIDCPMFFMECTEQALAINVKDKGVVIISGCGHQTIEKLVQRVELLFDESIYGMLGGFHLPLKIDRLPKVMSFFLTGRLPWEPLTQKDIEGKIEFLKAHKVKTIGISAHDSCDETIKMFKNAWQENYADIAVGKKITLMD